MLAGALAFLLLSVSLPISAQAFKPAAKSGDPGGWTAPKTADGQPDLQGVWSNLVDTPLERPEGLGAKEFYTPEEKVQREARRAQAARPRQAEPGTVADVHYDLGQFGLDRSHSKSAVSTRTSLIAGPEGKIPALLPAAQKRQADRVAAIRGHQFDGPEYRGLSERCITWPNEGPPMLSPGYNSNLQIVQGPGYVAILQEMIHDVRVIPLDGRPHATSAIRQWFGDSRGHWEGNTLVVDTTNFSGRFPFYGSSDQLHVVERFTRTAEDAILYQFTVEDPATWAKPWSAEVPWVKIEGPVFEYACQEGNYGMANVLSGARAAEKEAAAK
ncbi:MAG: hypothetical protein C5B51_32040 [Terriglobia bacterium]|nr:MAG: hypothetical protein C5B51_32040 [Terriglobia bacterium]